jgi:hypothetical protein
MAGLFGPVPSAKPGSRGETAGAKRIHDMGRPQIDRFFSRKLVCDFKII